MSTTLPLTSAAAGTAAGTALRFETVFATAGEPRTIGFTATYVVRGTPHVVQVWRDGGVRLKRVTDGGVTTLVVRKTDDPEFRMTVVDPKKHTVTTIDRTNLYRLGNFVDWFDLAHGLRHPHGAYTLASGAVPHGVAPSIGRCTWYDLTNGPATTHVCWSTNDRLPLTIAGASGTVVWRVTAIDRRPLAADTFRVADTGFVHVDANRDIDRD